MLMPNVIHDDDRHLRQRKTDGQEISKEYDYQNTILIGRFRNDAPNPSTVLPPLTKSGRSTDDIQVTQLPINRRRTCTVDEAPKIKKATFKSITRSWLRSAGVLSEDWIYLGLLGVIMAVLSYLMDLCISSLHSLHSHLFESASSITPFGWSIVLSYATWIISSVGMVLIATTFVNKVAPQAIGSGIPEMKTILQGVVLKEYLTVRTGVAKIVGLMLMLGSGMPIGKSGPFVHIASVIATQLSLLITSFKNIYVNESRKSEMLSAACAVGVACTFGAPIGGVLFSIEVTAVFFDVRNYWRGFFAAACSALVFKLIDVIVGRQDTISAFYETSLPRDDAFYPEEMVVFVGIAIICGLGGAFFVYFHRLIVTTLRASDRFKKLSNQSFLIYPFIISVVISSIQYPNGLGQFIGGELRLHAVIKEFFSGFSYQDANLTGLDAIVANRWHGGNGIKLWLSITSYVLIYFVISAFANTMPIPSGIFIPAMAMGAGIGRLVGEFVYLLFPRGLYEDVARLISPGVYAVIGGASFTGAVTHSVSVSVIILEMTGRVSFILPIMISVIIADAVAALLQPSIYDSIIRIKHLPCIPDIPTTNSLVHTVHTGTIMVSEVAYITTKSTYAQVQSLLYARPRLRAFPLVDNTESMILLGSITKRALVNFVDDHLGVRARLAEAQRRKIARNNEEVKTERPSILPKLTNDSVYHVIDAITKVPSVSRFVVSKTASSPRRSTSPKTEALQTIAEGCTPRPSADDCLSLDENVFDESTTTTDSPENVANAANAVNAANAANAVDNRAFDATDEDEIQTDTSNNTTTTAISDVVRPRANSSSDKSKNSSPSKSSIKWHNNLTVHVGSAMNTMRSYVNTIGGRKIGQSHNQGLDLSDTQRELWETEKLAEIIDVSRISVDPAPFQLVERTSLYKTHSLFSLLGLNRAYVTNCGRLVGVVALRELRVALEMTQRGVVPCSHVDDECAEHDDDKDVEIGITVDRMTQDELLYPAKTANKTKRIIESNK